MFSNYSNIDLNSAQNDAIDAELLALELILGPINDDQNDVGTTYDDKEVPRLTEDNTFTDTFSYDIDLPDIQLCEAAAISATKTDELDSSDDEGVRNFLERKYNEYGSDINNTLKQEKAAQHENKVACEVNAALKSYESAPQSDADKRRQSQLSTTFKRPPLPRAKTATTAAAASASAIFTDPVFGLHIINPLVSSKLLVERMSGRQAVAFSNIPFHTERGDLAKDWVIAGVLVNKSPIRKSKTGIPFSIWRLSDLRSDMKMVSLFLFKGAHKDLWKTAQGMCLAVLNPNIFEKSGERGDIASLSIDTSQKVMILGQSKDLGTCKAKKRNNEQCNAVVNLSDSEFCVFHVKQEFNKMSRRSELQSSSAGRGLNELRNKVLGKSEVFYGGHSYTAVPVRKSAKLVAKDTRRMSELSEYAVSPLARAVNHPSKPKRMATTTVPYAPKSGPITKSASNLEACAKQRSKDLERLKILQAEARTPRPPKSVDNSTKVLASLKKSPNEPVKTRFSSSNAALKSTELQKVNNDDSLNISHTGLPNTIDKSVLLPKTKTATIVSLTETESDTIKNSNLSLPSTPTATSTKTLASLASIPTSTKTLTSILSQNESNENVTDSSIANLIPEKFKNSTFSFSTMAPQLSRDTFESIEINTSNQKSQLSKQKAINILKKQPIEKTNPNAIRGSKEGKKRAIDELNDQFCNVAKRQKLEEERQEAERKTRIQRIMDATSSHTNLLQMCQQEAQEKYFNKLEKKEALENKMLNTYKMPCKAVICKKCKYTSFSAAERCKEEKHPLKIIDAEKRFFQCKDCGSRTTTVFKLPKTSCKNCKGSRWVRAAMIREPKTCNVAEGLSIRGDEECFIGNLAGGASLNLLVPDV